MISFFALQPDTATARQISNWRDQHLPPLDKPVASSNFHITLAYLGETADWQLDQLLNGADYGEFQPFSMHLDQLGYWAKPRVLWLGAREIPQALDTLARTLSSVAGMLRLQRDRRPYAPHLTLARKLASPPPAATDAPYFSLQFNDFVLMESCRSPGKTTYRIVEKFK